MDKSFALAADPSPGGIVAPRSRTNGYAPLSRLARGAARPRSSIDLSIRGPFVKGAPDSSHATIVVDQKIGWVRLFQGAARRRSFDHLISLRCGRDGDSG